MINFLNAFYNCIGSLCHKDCYEIIFIVSLRSYLKEGEIKIPRKLNRLKTKPKQNVVPTTLRVIPRGSYVT